MPTTWSPKSTATALSGIPLNIIPPGAPLTVQVARRCRTTARGQAFRRAWPRMGSIGWPHASFGKPSRAEILDQLLTAALRPINRPLTGTCRVQRAKSGTIDAESPGEILGSRLNCQLSERGSLRSVRYAANASAETGPGSHGSGIKGASRTILPDPQRPHRCRAEDETILQFSQ